MQLDLDLAISTEQVIPLVFTTGPVAIVKCLENGHLAVDIFGIDHDYAAQCVDIIPKMGIFLLLCPHTH